MIDITFRRQVFFSIFFSGLDLPTLKFSLENTQKHDMDLEKETRINALFGELEAIHYRFCNFIKTHRSYMLETEEIDKINEVFFYPPEARISMVPSRTCWDYTEVDSSKEYIDELFDTSSIGMSMEFFLKQTESWDGMNMSTMANMLMRIHRTMADHVTLRLEKVCSEFNGIVRDSSYAQKKLEELQGDRGGGVDEEVSGPISPPISTQNTPDGHGIPVQEEVPPPPAGVTIKKTLKRRPDAMMGDGGDGVDW
jgi:hypothetical protein